MAGDGPQPLVEGAAELQQLASQCLWDAVAPSEPEAAVRSARPLSVTDHVRTLKTRSIFNPAPISAMMTTNSLKRSVNSG